MNTASTAATPASAAPAGRFGAGTTAAVLATLARREFWEHRALWVAPLVTAVLLALSALPGAVHLGEIGSHAGWPAGEQKRVAVFTLTQWGLSVPLYLVMLVVLSYYLLDCLYAERKDRSILFWKSLPVSDALTVLAKLLVALVVVPLGVFALALLSHLLFTGIFELRMHAGSLPAVLAWDTKSWLSVELLMLLGVVLGALWYAPLAAYLLLVSAWARRSPFLWAAVPPLVASLLERIAFGTDHLQQFINYRLLGIWGALGLANDRFVHAHVHLRSLAPLLGELDFRAAFTDLDLWLGIAATAALLLATVRIRRYRDDT